MPRSLSVAMQTHLASENQSRTLMLRIDTTRGEKFGMTEHDLPIPFDMEDGAGTLLYESDPAIFPSQLELSAGFEPDDVGFRTNLTAAITRARLFNGFFDDATVYLYQINWRNLDAGIIPLFKGFTTDIELEDNQATITTSSEIAKFQYARGRLVTPYCDAQLGDEKCTKVVIPIVAEVLSVEGPRNITVDFGGAYVDDHFNKGTIEFLDGPLYGGRRLEVFDQSSDGTIELWNRMATTQDLVGTTMNLRIGCGNTIDDCVTIHNNGINFQGFPYAPGRDRFLRFGTPPG